MTRQVLGPEGVVPQDQVLTVSMDNSKPVLLSDFTNSFLSLADEYARFATSRGGDDITRDTRLYVREVRKGSIVWDLVVVSAAALPIVEYTVTLADFGMYVKTAWDWLLRRSGDDPRLDKKRLQNVVDIMEPVAKDSASQININVHVEGNLVLNFTSDSVQANAIQNAARRELSALVEPVTGIHDGVVLYFYQARNDPKSHAGDRAVIESISPVAVKTIFRTEEVKARALRTHENPFLHAYLVDVAVETVDGRPVVYRVLDVREPLPLPDSARRRLQS